MPLAYKKAVSAAIVAVFLGMTAGTTSNAAPDPAPSPNAATIAGNAFETVPGSLHINQAAGDANAQANIASIETGRGTLPARLTQQVQAPNAGGGAASVREDAFSDISGLVQLNQTAGSGNAQGNVAIVRIGVSAAALTDDALAGAMPAQTVTNNGAPNPNRVTNTVGNDASTFHGKGVVQVNQTAGTGNATANGFLLQLQQGVPH